MFQALGLDNALGFSNLSSMSSTLDTSGPLCSVTYLLIAEDSPSTSSKINMTSPHSVLQLPSRMWLAAIESRVAIKGKPLPSKGKQTLSAVVSCSSGQEDSEDGVTRKRGTIKI